MSSGSWGTSVAFFDPPQRLPMNPGTSSSVLGAALDLAKRGFSVLPVHGVGPDGFCTCGRPDCGSAGKHPRTKSGVKEASRDEAQIRAWFTKWPDANVAIATGAASWVVVLDVDGEEGLESLKRLEERHGKIETLTAFSGGGGLHAFFEYPGRETKNRVNWLSEGGYPGLDIRGDGGYVVAPPSSHKSGKEYEWHGDPDLPPSPLPNWLSGLLAGDRRNGKGVLEQTLQGPSSPEPIPLGGRDNTLTSLAGHLRNIGSTGPELEQMLHVVNQSRCEPPLEDRDVRKIAKSADRNFQGRSLSRGMEPGSLETLRRIDLSGPFSPPEPLIGYLLSPGEVGLLYGEPASRKSFIAHSIAFSIQHGLPIPWLGQEAGQGDAVLGSFEAIFEHRQRWAAWVEYFGQQHKLTSKHPLFLPSPTLDRGGKLTLDHPEWPHRFLDVVGEPPVLLVFDTLVRMISGDESDMEVIGRALNNVEEVARELGSGILLTHHTKKNEPERYIGSSLLERNVSMMAFVKKVDRFTSKVEIKKHKGGLGEAEYDVHFRRHPLVPGILDAPEGWQGPKDTLVVVPRAEADIDDQPSPRALSEGNTGST